MTTFNDWFSTPAARAATSKARRGGGWILSVLHRMQRLGVADLALAVDSGLLQPTLKLSKT